MQMIERKPSKDAHQFLEILRPNDKHNTHATNHFYCINSLIYIQLAVSKIVLHFLLRIVYTLYQMVQIFGKGRHMYMLHENRQRTCNCLY